MKTYLTLPNRVKVCAEGCNPNTGTSIQSKCVGYYDSTGHLYLTDEKLTIEMSNITGSISKRWLILIILKISSFIC